MALMVQIDIKEPSKHPDDDDWLDPDGWREGSDSETEY